MKTREREIEDEIIADEIVTAVYRRTKKASPIWSAALRPGFTLNVYQDGAHHDWILLSGARLVGGGSLKLMPSGEHIVQEAGIYEEWEGMKLYSDVLRALAFYFGEICTRELGTVSPLAQRAWARTGGQRNGSRYCLKPETGMRETTEREPFRDFVERLRREREALRDEVREEIKRTGAYIKQTSERDARNGYPGGWITITRSTREGVDWQVTFWEGNPNGASAIPSGHLDIVGSIENAIKEVPVGAIKRR